MIEVRALTKKYGENLAINNLNFNVNKGEVVGFLGPNGAGKSTTMKIITGFMAPTSGEARVCGFDVFESPLEVKRRIGYLPETPPVYGDMRVREYLDYVAELKGVPANLRAKGVDGALEKTNLGAVEKRLIQNLSKGFRQRVGIAQALVSNPEVLILDEPTVGLDPKQVAEIRDLIKELRGEHTVILSTHILPEVQATCERIIIINRGHIVAQDSLENLSALQASGRRIHLKLRKAQETAPGFIGGTRGVRAVKAGATPVEWEIDAETDEQIIEDLARAAMDQGYGLLEIGSVKVGLEDIFMKLTYGSGESAPTAEV
ncbi:MAG: ABC transporter ATP-binding protein [Bdellovibrionaceae bacterium]|nr:ABC transporter ATP-binding protein [Pseudobdellovibrionaceae bacterium]